MVVEANVLIHDFLYIVHDSFVEILLLVYNLDGVVDVVRIGGLQVGVLLRGGHRGG